VESILTLLSDSNSHVADVGCGDGRLVIPLAHAGYTVIGIDIDQAAIAACSARCTNAGVDAKLIVGDLFDVLPLKETVDAIVCCGQTFMLLADVEQAVDALRLFRSSLSDGGVVIFDDIPGDVWPEVMQGNWVSGISEDASMQFVWADNDAVFAIREGDQINTDSWQIGEDDRQFRLWTMGALKLAAALAGLSAPEVPVAGAVLIMRATSQ